MHPFRVALVMLAVVVLAGCAHREDRIARLDHVVGASCPRGPEPNLSLSRQTLPDDFVPVQVIRCRWEYRYLPGKGRWEVVVEEHADGPAGELMTELRRPSERSMFGVNCLDILIVADYFVVVDSSGRVVLPDLPTGVCGGPFSSALDVLRGLPYQVDEQIPVRRVESDKAFRTGCGDEYPDLLSRGRPGATTQTWNPPPKGLRVCIFRTDGKTSDTDEGKFESVRILKGSSLRTLLTALDTAPASDCPSDHTRFAVLNPGHYKQAYVELDGCRNLLRPDGTLGRLTPDAVALLTD
ncbi:hypothetical protein SAMN05216276_100325 [Streptosporangium subroseum]|uniref:Lipoprotein n=1 Tax=Streptosporangium subroseum TaxID=106412 RepID=A0A239B8E2_9ACTN|nr:hypothetical protein [Streptosporangium subroseum]SNS04019.1 hypothetical protein SAMN05216276_100325 [Streptosporangium subroseum]